MTSDAMANRVTLNNLGPDGEPNTGDETDPTNPDTDGDSLTDGDERVLDLAADARDVGALDDAVGLAPFHVQVDGGEVVQLVAERERVSHVDRPESHVRLQAAREPGVTDAKEPLAKARRKVPQRDFLQSSAASAALARILDVESPTAAIVTVS